jgi:hypothetical protein
MNLRAAVAPNAPWDDFENQPFPQPPIHDGVGDDVQIVRLAAREVFLEAVNPQTLEVTCCLYPVRDAPLKTHVGVVGQITQINDKNLQSRQSEQDPIPDLFRLINIVYFKLFKAFETDQKAFQGPFVLPTHGIGRRRDGGRKIQAVNVPLATAVGAEHGVHRDREIRCINVHGTNLWDIRIGNKVQYETAHIAGKLGHGFILHGETPP